MPDSMESRMARLDQRCDDLTSRMDRHEGEIREVSRLIAETHEEARVAVDHSKEAKVRVSNSESNLKELYVSIGILKDQMTALIRDVELKLGQLSKELLTEVAELRIGQAKQAWVAGIVAAAGTAVMTAMIGYVVAHFLKGGP